MLTDAEVTHIAHLARLNLTEEEKERFRRQLSAILEYAARLKAVDVSVLPSAPGLDASTTILRPDETNPGLALEAILANAPESESRQFKVPPILE